MISRMASAMRSDETTGPTVVRVRCSAIGPSCASSARRSAPSSPWVGSVVLPPGCAVGLGDVPGLADGLAEGLALGLALGAVLPEGAGLADAPALAEAPALGAGVAERSPADRPRGTVRISRKPWPMRVTAASRPWVSITLLTWSGLTASSEKRTTHTV